MPTISVLRGAGSQVSVLRQPGERMRGAGTTLPLVPDSANAILPRYAIGVSFIPAGKEYFPFDLVAVLCR